MIYRLKWKYKNAWIYIFIIFYLCNFFTYDGILCNALLYPRVFLFLSFKIACNFYSPASHYVNTVYRIIKLFCKLNGTIIYAGDLFNYLIKVNARYIRRFD